MDLLLEQETPRGKAFPFWGSPSAWLRDKQLSKDFWLFFITAFFFDAGFSVYFFLFNLFLLDLHFNDRAIGLINGSLTLGSLIATLPVGALARRFGLRPLLLVCLVAAPLLGILRATLTAEPAQIVLAFIAGIAMCHWAVCFLPTVARLTTEKNRTSAISLIFSVGVGTSALGGAVCGYLPQWLRMAGMGMAPAEVKRLILILSCVIAAFGLLGVLRLRMPAQQQPEASERLLPQRAAWLRNLRPSAFLWRFLLCMTLWSAMIAAFTPFANIYLSRDLHIPLARVGLIFSITQVLQLLMGLLLPLIFRFLGMIRGIVATQLATALSLALLAVVHSESIAIALYLAFSAAQWMSAPGLYNLLMDETPDEERSNASAMTMFSNSLAGSWATAGAGILFTRFGYSPVLLGLAAFAVAVAMLCRLLLAHQHRRPKGA